LLAALIIVFREVLEAGLIIGVVLAASRGVPGRSGAILLGVLAGLAGSAVVAVFASQISNAFSGRGQEIFTAVVLLVAVAMLAWHVVWMAQHAREMTARLRELGQAVLAGNESVFVLGVAVGAAVMREGSEVVLFLAGIIMQGASNTAALALGSLGGLLLGAAVSAVVYSGLMVVPLKRVFTVTGVLVTLLAAGLAAEAVRQLSNAGLINVLDGTLWDTSWLLGEDSWPGRVLHVLIGYMDRPNGIEVLAYVATVATIFLLAQRVHQRPVTEKAKLHALAASSRRSGLTDRDAA
jgi:high-affinity iron transporter